MTTAPATHGPASLGGYRLVRILGTGPRATVHLGHAGGVPQVAVKVFAATVPVEQIEREAEALMRAAGEHVVSLVDLAQDSAGRPVFLLERIAGPSLGALLTRRRAIRAGEAVTILAPLAATLARLHRSGVVHGGLDPASVLFTEAGSPTLAGFGDAELLDRNATGRARVAERTELVDRDVAALHRLVLTVLDATELDTTEPAKRSTMADAERALRDLGGQLGPGYPERLESAVFDLADPEPVDLDAWDGSAAALPGRIATDPGSRAGADRPRGMVLDALQLPEWLSGMLGSRSRAVAGRPRTAVRSVRRPFWVFGGLAAGGLAAVLLLEPTGGARQRATPAVPSGDGVPGASSASSAPGAPPSAVARALHGDDPAVAAGALLELRAECFRELSVLCLDAVNQPGSSAEAADAAAILAAQQGNGIGPGGVVSDGRPETVERMGDTALVRIRSQDAEPASVLVIRTEAGWRIRSFPGAARTGEAG